MQVNQFCELCEIKLTSVFAGRNRRKYCEDCSKNYRKNLNKIYCRRNYQKKTGNTTDTINARNALSFKRPKLDSKRIEAYKKARQEGCSYADIAFSHGITKQAVYKVLKPLLTNNTIVS